MGTCKKCEAIVPNRRDEPGHGSLISLGLVRTLGQEQRGVKHEAFTCADCGTDWDYLHDKRDPASGWSRCAPEPRAEAAVAQPQARMAGAA
ncbi:hypothetical protein [Achromobacter anxifer]|uniref:Uncharacterized protein n=1 Tax=Achromobacter anxifer TaxID=1287737 RepID=A0A6S7DZT8_9BURK|nr:hypothetical protein [Achromobacter anxifer]MDF8362600.1 hypothetical protein [Achromobacter anxifer]CAB3880425.1 hypothetical protein LMG26858_03198 [Achromobacter anxifer]CAB5512469.1 hypothetical protein LMG26857_01759 [Achromobacter anxifer]